jgi:hypothetical protein
MLKEDKKVVEIEKLKKERGQSMRRRRRRRRRRSVETGNRIGHVHDITLSAIFTLKGMWFGIITIGGDFLRLRKNEA